VGIKKVALIGALVAGFSMAVAPKAEAQISDHDTFHAVLLKRLKDRAVRSPSDKIAQRAYSIANNKSDSTKYEDFDLFIFLCQKVKKSDGTFTMDNYREYTYRDLALREDLPLLTREAIFRIDSISSYIAEDKVCPYVN
jgi:hypothetical protein